MIVQTLEGVVWMLDPIDGTMNFIHQKRNFAISLGIYAEGVGMLGYIYDVMRDDFYHAAKDEGAYFNDERLPQLEITPLDRSCYWYKCKMGGSESLSLIMKKLLS